MNIIQKIVFILILIYFPLSNAHAYIDGGSGSLMLQLLFGGVAGGVAIIKLYWNQIKEKIFGCNKQTTTDTAPTDTKGSTNEEKQK